MPLLQPKIVATNDNAIEEPESLENLEKPEVESEDVHEDNAGNGLAEGNSSNWCTEGIVAGDWVQCEDGPLCENCRF